MAPHVLSLDGVACASPAPSRSQPFAALHARVLLYFICVRFPPVFAAFRCAPRYLCQHNAAFAYYHALFTSLFLPFRVTFAILFHNPPAVYVSLFLLCHSSTLIRVGGCSTAICSRSVIHLREKYMDEDAWRQNVWFIPQKRDGDREPAETAFVWPHQAYTPPCHAAPPLGYMAKHVEAMSSSVTPSASYHEYLHPIVRNNG